MATSNQTANAPYDLQQIEDDIASLQGTVSDLEEVIFFLLNGPQPPNALSDRVQLYANNSQNLPAWQDPTGFNGVIPATNTTWFPVNTVTGTGLGNLASQQIPANNAQPNAVYEIECWGSGTQGSTAQTLQFAVGLGGNTMSSVTLGTNYMIASASFRWYVMVRAICHTNGASGTWSSLIRGELSVNGQNLLTSGASSANATNAFVSCEIASTTTVDTTVSEQFGLNAAWGSTTGAPTLTSRVAMYRRWF